MTEIKLFEKDLGEIINIVNDLKRSGFILHHDFDFAYVPGNHDYINEQDSIPHHVEFIFHQESLASWFALKYI